MSIPRGAANLTAADGKLFFTDDYGADSGSVMVQPPAQRN